MDLPISIQLGSLSSELLQVNFIYSLFTIVISGDSVNAISLNWSIQRLPR